MGTGRTLRAVLVSPLVGQRLRSFFSKPKGPDLVVLQEFLEAGKLTPVIDRTFPSARPLRRSGMSASGPPKAKPSSPCEERQATALITDPGAECSGADPGSCLPVLSL
jgi:hypothetical protein